MLRPDMKVTGDASGVFLNILREMNRERLAAPAMPGDDAKVIGPNGAKAIEHDEDQTTP